MKHRWILLNYKVPSEPSARRVYVWRKLKRIAAISIHDAVWVLPATDQTREQFEWLAAEIIEFGGEAYLWEAASLFAEPEARLVQQFREQADSAYQQLLDEIRAGDVDWGAMSRRYQQVKSQDYFQSALEQEVREALLKARGDQS